MGVEPFLVTASVNLVVAQRLARRICSDCKAPTSYTDQAMLDVGFKQEELKDLKLMKGTGCNTCGDSGYKGRVALYEVMPFRDQLKELVLQGCSTAELKQEMIRIGITSLRMAGLAKVRAGMTTIEEVLRTTTSDTN
jgi:type IV pilus assembly protein PilB